MSSIEQQAKGKKDGEIRYLTPLNIETNKGNTIVTNDKLKTMEQKINEMEKDFKNFLIMRSTLTGEK